jgi:hypothetical protein
MAARLKRGPWLPPRRSGTGCRSVPGRRPRASVHVPRRQSDVAILAAAGRTSKRVARGRPGPAGVGTLGDKMRRRRAHLPPQTRWAESSALQQNATSRVSSRPHLMRARPWQTGHKPTSLPALSPRTWGARAPRPRPRRTRAICEREGDRGGSKNDAHGGRYRGRSLPRCARLRGPRFRVTYPVAVPTSARKSLSSRDRTPRRPTSPLRWTSTMGFSTATFAWQKDQSF